MEEPPTTNSPNTLEKKDPNSSYPNSISPKLRCSLDNFIDVAWPEFDRQGWTLERGIKRKTDFYIFPPGVHRRRGFNCRVHYFDSMIQVHAFIQGPKGNAKLREAFDKARRLKSEKTPKSKSRTSQFVTKHNCSKVGEKYNALVLDWNGPHESISPLNAEKVWDPSFNKQLEIFEEFCRNPSQKEKTSIEKMDQEQLITILQLNNYSIPRSIKDIENRPVEYLPLKRWKTWTKDETKIFHEAMMQLDSQKFRTVGHKLPNRKRAEIVEYFYARYKKSTQYDEFKAARSKQSYFLQEEICHTCKIDIPGVSLLLCDGCPNVFHLPCCIPPLTMIPEGDWECHVCLSRKNTKTNDTKKNKSSNAKKGSRNTKKTSKTSTKNSNNTKDLEIDKIKAKGKSKESGSANPLIVKNETKEVSKSPFDPLVTCGSGNTTSGGGICVGIRENPTNQSLNDSSTCHMEDEKVNKNVTQLMVLATSSSETSSSGKVGQIEGTNSNSDILFHNLEHKQASFCYECCMAIEDAPPIVCSQCQHSFHVACFPSRLVNRSICLYC